MKWKIPIHAIPAHRMLDRQINNDIKAVYWDAEPWGDPPPEKLPSGLVWTYPQLLRAHQAGTTVELTSIPRVLISYQIIDKRILSTFLDYAYPTKVINFDAGLPNGIQPATSRSLTIPCEFADIVKGVEIAIGSKTATLLIAKGDTCYAIISSPKGNSHPWIISNTNKITNYITNCTIQEFLEQGTRNYNLELKCLSPDDWLVSSNNKDIRLSKNPYDMLAPLSMWPTEDKIEIGTLNE